MKAITYERYGTPDVMTFTEIPKPIEKDNEILVKVKASSYNKADSLVLNGKPFVLRLMGNGLFKPKHTVLGTDFSGVVESVGKNVTHLNVGDEVFGDMAAHGFGALSEYLCVPADAVAIKPKEFSFEEIAALPIAGVTAYKAVFETITINPNDKVLVNGASGCVGIFVVQMLKARGASVTATSSSEKKAMVKSLGADRVLDYATENFLDEGKRYDVIIDIAIQEHIRKYSSVLTETGVHILVGGNMKRFFQTLFLRSFMSTQKKQQLILLNFKVSTTDYKNLVQLLERGSIRTVIDRVFPLKDAAIAMDYFESKKSCGKVVIRM